MIPKESMKGTGRMILNKVKDMKNFLTNVHTRANILMVNLKA